jgi:hypothetical protein
MSEVDRLGNSGLYPMLPIADKRGSKDGSSKRGRDDAPAPDKTSANPPDSLDPRAPPRPPKSLIDEYA